MNAWTQTPWVKALLLTVGLGVVFAVIYLLRVVLIPFFIALALAYLLDPAVDELERLHLPRTLAVVLLLVGVLAAVAGGAIVIYPAVRLQVETLAAELPRYLETLQDWITPLIKRVSQMDPGRVQALLQEALQRFEGVPLQLLAGLSRVLGSTLVSLYGLITIALNLFVIPVATFYFLRDIDRMRAAFPTFLPVSYREWVMAKLAEIDMVLAGFVRGQLIVALILTGFYSIGLTLVGTPSSVLLGILTGVASVIPFMGLVVGFPLSLALTFLRFYDWQHPVGVLAVFAAVILIDANFITPKVMGERLGLHPVVVLLAVLVGGHLFGFLGILLAVPMAAVFKVFWRSILDFYRDL
ncbi:MAG: AI-2E family transporter [Nitrospinae bacterium]|nr:AI-2E family transporter [Nitrospinota bacterium]